MHTIQVAAIVANVHFKAVLFGHFAVSTAVNVVLVQPPIIGMSVSAADKAMLPVLLDDAFHSLTP